MLKTLYDLFTDSVVKGSNRPFLINTAQCLTYEEVRVIASNRAGILFKSGVHMGDRLFIVDEDPLETTLWILACILAGVIFVVLHKKISAMRMYSLIRDAKPVGIIDIRLDAPNDYCEIEHLGFIIATKPIIEEFSDEDVLLPVIEIIETDPAFLIYTSGSTGHPKGIICPNNAVLSAVISISSFLPNGSDDRIGSFLPLSFDYGLYQIFLAMYRQSSICFLGDFQAPNEFLDKLRAFKITCLPALLSVLVALTRLSDTYCEHLKYITSTGDYLPSSLIEKVYEKFPNILFFSMYGLSECKRALYMPPDRLFRKLSSVGRPIPGTRAYIVNEQRQPVPFGEIGELLIEGPHIMSGYWNAPEETMRKFVRNSYNQLQLLTEDLFFQDEEGDFHFVGRKSELIKCNGFRISPREVELALLAVDSTIRECIVYGVEDELRGQAICAEVTVDDSMHTIADIFACCRTKMDAYMVPTKICIVNEIRKTVSGKYSRRYH